MKPPKFDFSSFASDLCLSMFLRERTDSGRAITPQHLQQACQCPSQWTISSRSWIDARLSRRKIIYRALLGRVIQRLFPHTQHPTSEEGAPSRVLCEGKASLDDAEAPSLLGGLRLGRLNGKDYADWPTFLHKALIRLASPPDSPLHAIDVDSVVSAYLNGSNSTNEPDIETKLSESLARRLGCMHVFRALLGELVESLIIADRMLFLAEELSKGEHQSERGLGEVGWKLKAWNVFELESGSARNVVIVAERLDG